MYRLLSYLLLMLTQVWAFVVNLPKSKIVKKLSQGFSKLIGSTVWDPRSIRHMSHELLREAGRLTPSRAFLPRLNSMTSSMLVARSRAASILDDWGFHVDHDNLESKKDEVDPVHPRRRDFSEHSTHIHEGCQKFELREADINDEAVNLDDLWKWEDENMRYCLHREELTKHDYDSEGPSISPTSVTQHAKIESYHSHLQESPEFIHNLQLIFERAHWECSKTHKDSGAHLSIVGDDLIIGFRGTATLHDVAIDLRVQPVKGPHEVRVHKGFRDAVESVNKDNSLTETIKALVRGRGLKRVIVTGYSLGAATAALYLISAGDELQQAGIDIRCVTFGCPRFVESHDVDKLPFHLTSRIMNTYVEGDPIPLGLTSMLGLTDYRHIGYSMVIDKCGERFRLHDGDGTRGHDEVIKWWGLKTPQAHLSENYDQKLKTIEDTLLKNKFRTFGVNAVRMTRV